jgi:nucleotide-binding universal stress UspA family protein/CBS domain-containing protein
MATKSILCPVDLSENSFAAIELATKIAKADGAKLGFIYVAPQWLPEEAMYGDDYIRTIVAADKEEFQMLRPTDRDVEYEHIFVEGNAGPEVVRASKRFDLVVMSTHGRSGVMRFLMGSVAQYVLRNAKCPVVTIRPPTIEKAKKSKDTKDSKDSPVIRFVTEVMRQVSPFHYFDNIKEVEMELNNASQTAAPVVDGSGECIGVVTMTDIAKYHELLTRFENHDESVIDEMFETDQYGQRRPTNEDFHQVRRHMTTPVITIINTETEKQAIKLFKDNPKIHHLIVVDDSNHAVGIIELQDITSYSAAEAQS